MYSIEEIRSLGSPRLFVQNKQYSYAYIIIVHVNLFLLFLILIFILFLSQTKRVRGNLVFVFFGLQNKTTKNDKIIG